MSLASQVSVPDVQVNGGESSSQPGALPLNMCSGLPSYAYADEDGVNEDLLCGICLQPYENPVVACPNGHSYCKSGLLILRRKDLEAHVASCTGGSGSASTASRKRKRESSTASFAVGSEIAANTSVGEWLLATIFRVSGRDKYEVESVGGSTNNSGLANRRYTVASSSILPIVSAPSTSFEVGSSVLALYPGVQRFYPATVLTAPQGAADAEVSSSNYEVHFLRDEMDEKRTVVAKYVVREVERRYKLRAR
ncbi:hypothetical protein HDU93_008658 [Gonapodya sp. JEL0774]|nr:hypothetical protein HDU93_008658 [Gonapodya sp. JEL0774]